MRAFFCVPAASVAYRRALRERAPCLRRRVTCIGASPPQSLFFHGAPAGKTLAQGRASPISAFVSRRPSAPQHVAPDLGRHSSSSLPTRRGHPRRSAARPRSAGRPLHRLGGVRFSPCPIFSSLPGGYIVISVRFRSPRNAAARLFLWGRVNSRAVDTCLCSAGFRPRARYKAARFSVYVYVSERLQAYTSAS